MEADMTTVQSYNLKNRRIFRTLDMRFESDIFYVYTFLFTFFDSLLHTARSPLNVERAKSQAVNIQMMMPFQIQMYLYIIENLC